MESCFCTVNGDINREILAATLSPQEINFDFRTNKFAFQNSCVE